MNLIMKNLFHPFKKEVWNIYLSAIGKYQLVEVTDPTVLWNDFPTMYIILLEFLFKKFQIIVLSQFIDESQGMLSDKEQILTELSKIYGLQVVVSKEYTSAIQPLSESREYVLNAIGKPTI